MDWNRIKRKTAAPKKVLGVYANLDDLIRIQFKVGDFSFLPSQPVSSILSGRYASRLRGRGMNFEELRQYQTGDDIRNMDWKVTARTRSPHVRVYTEEKDRCVILLVDQRINMFFGTKEKMKSVTAAELAAVGAWRSIAVGDRVGAIIFNDTDLVEITPQRSQQTVMSILGNIVRMNHMLRADSEVQPNGSMINRALEAAQRLAPHDVLVILISDLFGVDKQTERLVTGLASHNDILALVAYDPVRKSPFKQSLIVSDGKLEIEVDLTKKSSRNKIIDDFQVEIDKATVFLRKLSAPLFMISNEGDVTNQIRTLLGGGDRISQ